MLVFDGTAERMDKLASAIDEIDSPGLVTVYAPVSDVSEEFHEEPRDTREGSSCVEAKEERMTSQFVCGSCRFAETSCHCGMSTSDDDSSDDGSECEFILRLRQKFAEERERKKLEESEKKKLAEEREKLEESERKKLAEERKKLEESERKRLAVESASGAFLESEEMDEDCCPCGRVLCDCMDSPSDIVTSSSDDSDDDACEEDNNAELAEGHVVEGGEGEEDGDDQEDGDDDGYGDDEEEEEGEKEAKSQEKESPIRPDAIGGAGPGVDFGRAARLRQGRNIRIVSVSSFPRLVREGDIHKLRQRFLGLRDWVNDFFKVPDQDTSPGILPMLADELNTIEFLRSMYRHNLQHVQSMNSNVGYGDIDALNIERRILTGLMRLIRLKQDFEGLQSQITRYMVDHYCRD